MSEDIIPSGYSEEERYFHEHDAELLQKKRAELDAKRKAEKQQESRTEHWMKCPKCGADMDEIEMEGIMVDRCPGCQGIYFDAGELELLISSRQSTGVMTSLRKLFG